MAKLTPKVYFLYRKLKDRYPGKWYTSYKCGILWRFFTIYPNWIEESKQIVKDRDRIHQRRKRIRKYIRDMIENRGYCVPCLFSLTFRDEVLQSTNESTRKKYVQEYLNSVCRDWFACVDFGKKNGREHYHAIATLEFIVPSEKFLKKKNKIFIRITDPQLCWPYGFMSIRPIFFSDTDLNISLNYAFKSSNYAFKSSNTTVKPFHKRGGFISIEEGNNLF